MPALKNHKHEWFAQELAKGHSATEAYVLAGYKESRAAASRLSTKDNIVARRAEIQARSAIKTDVTLASLMQEASDIQAAAMEARQLSAATAALTVKAKLAGLWVDKAENTNRNVDPARVSDSELAEVIQTDSGAGAAAASVNTEKSDRMVH